VYGVWCMEFKNSDSQQYTYYQVGNLPAVDRGTRAVCT